MPFQKLSIVIPVYNEELYVTEVLKQVLELPLPGGLKREIIVVDDGSTDQTRAILDTHTHDTLKIHFQEKNFGKGAAIREALKHVTGDIVLIQDADLEYSISDYPVLLEPILSGKTRVVYGSRFLGSLKGMRFPNRVFNLLIRFLVNVLFNGRITDEATAYKVFTTEVIEALRLESTRFEICPEMTAKLFLIGVPIYEVPIRYHGRTHTQGKKIRWTDAISAVWTLLKYRLQGMPALSSSPRPASALPKKAAISQEERRPSPPVNV